MKKKIIISVISMFIVIVIALITVSRIYEGTFIFLAPKYSKMNRYLTKNYDELSYVANALLGLEFDSISIEKYPLREEDKYNMIVSSKYLVYETVPIPNELVSHIQNLYESGVELISCGRESIGFTMWSSMDESRGIKYSPTGEKPNGEQLIKVEQLSKKNWYYYVHNYEKAKARNPHLFQ